MYPLYSEVSNKLTNVVIIIWKWSCPVLPTFLKFQRLGQWHLLTSLPGDPSIREKSPRVDDGVKLGRPHPTTNVSGWKEETKRVEYDHGRRLSFSWSSGWRPWCQLHQGPPVGRSLPHPTPPTDHLDIPFISYGSSGNRPNETSNVFYFIHFGKYWPFCLRR